MKPGLLSRFDFAMRSTTPFMLTVLLVVLGAVPLRIPDFATVSPLLSLMAVYHWSIYRPDLLPAWAVFVVGLMQDALTGLPFGINALVFLAVHMAVLSQHVFFTGKSFAIIWIGFAMVCGGAMLMMWILVSAFYAQTFSILGASLQFLVTLGAFPVLSLLMTYWQRRFLGET